jgi:hypothetical protein
MVPLIRDAVMTKHLTVRSDEAHRLAHHISDRTGRPVEDVVVEALREFGSKLKQADDLTPAQRAGYDALRALAQQTAQHKKPGATSDHSDMYDEFGLPK